MSKLLIAWFSVWVLAVAYAIFALGYFIGVASGSWAEANEKCEVAALNYKGQFICKNGSVGKNYYSVITLKFLIALPIRYL